MSIRINKHAGLLTYASPYLIPPGATVEQTNMQCLLPGQLTVRGGMKAAGQVSSGTPALELYGYSVGAGSTDKIFAFTPDGGVGKISIIESPDV